MSELMIIEYKAQRVMTTKVLAEQFGTDDKVISNNFNRNTERFIEEKHFYRLEGEELKRFKAYHLNDESLKYVSNLYLWTERGAARHAKILETDEAWQVYEILEETYFRVKSNFTPHKLPQTYSEALRELADKVEQNQKLLVENAELKPKAEFFDSVADSKDAIDIGSAAKVLNMGMGRNILFEVLRDNKVLMQNNQPYQKYIDTGYFRTIEQKFTKPDGSTCINIKTLVYQKGLEFIRRIITQSKAS